MTPQDIIIKPILTEKSSGDVAVGKYTFEVNKTATKTQIKDAVEKLFNVKVLSVATANYEGKMKRQRYSLGRTPSWKKAVVTIATESKDSSYLGKGGKTTKVSAKYKTSIEEFGFGQ
ncbi:MAG: 50S ribosomal protein L23 [Clostridiaceae bacterium]|jgi:large subunit ribosomal protein L23|nr:50S ribosomal protein L23 [Oscillospiraceae bacterium]NLO62297.1 50S ribosomal protein L23 [Clostridiaceae bacterium]